MKVKCIKNGGFLNLLTVGKTYEVIDDDNTKTYRYFRIDDTILDMDIGLKKKWFKPLSEIRNETINKLLEDES